LEKLAAAFIKKNKSQFRDWLEQQDAYNLPRTVRKLFLRNSYKLRTWWTCGNAICWTFHSLAKYNDMHSYIL